MKLEKPKTKDQAKMLLQTVGDLRDMAAATLNAADKLDRDMGAALAQVRVWAREWGIDT